MALTVNRQKAKFFTSTFKDNADIIFKGRTGLKTGMDFKG